MPAKLDLMNPAAASPDGRIDRRQPEARADRWKLELERAAMAGGARAGARGDQARPASDAARALRTDAQLPAQRGAQAAAGQGAPLAAAIGHHVAVPGVAGLPAGGAAAAAAAPGVTGRGAPGSTAAVLPGIAALLADGGDAQPGAARGAAAARPDAQQYARSLLHVVRGADGVHAWIRDAGLGEDQVRRVAAAMAGEFAQSGAPLAALTVNGKKIIAAGTAGRIDEAAPAAQPLTQCAVKGA